MKSDFKRGGWMMFIPFMVAFGGFIMFALGSPVKAEEAKKDGATAAAAVAGSDGEHKVHTKKWHFYDPDAKVDLSNARLFSGNATKELANEIARYLGLPVSPATVEHFADGEVNIQVIIT
jgi:hypothetical protein